MRTGSLETPPPRGRRAFVKRPASSRGSIVLFLVVLLAVVTTAIVSTISLTGGVESEVSSLTLHRDQAFYAAEAGVQRAYYEGEYGSWVYPPFVNGQPAYPAYTQTVGSCTYTIAATGQGPGMPVLVTSTGVYTANPQIKSVITATLQPTQGVAAIQLGASLTESGNITIDGNALVKGNINLGGKVSINGYIQYGGTRNNLSFATYNPNIPSPPQVWYDPTNSQTPPSGVINVNELISGNNALQFTDTTPSSLDFTSKSVLYIVVPSGQTLDLKNINVYGSGTLVVIGNVFIQNGLGDATDAVNVVATGSIQTQGNFRTFGSLYVGGDMTHQGQFQVTGVLTASQSMYPTDSNNGAGGATIVRAAPPAFDPRVQGGTQSVVVQNFTGPTL